MKVSIGSLFFAAARSFLVVFFGGWGFALLLLSITLLTTNVGGDTPKKKTLFHVVPDAEWKRGPLKDSSPLIVQVPLKGVIGVDISLEDIIDVLTDLQASTKVAQRIKAIFLYIDSPGGASSVSDNVYQALKGYKKQFQTPVYAFVDSLCASGGMLIACAADKIIATPTSCIGSVGVRWGPFFNYINAMDFLGLKAKTLTAGKNKDPFNPTRPWREDEGESLDKTIQKTYELFLDAVLSARSAMVRDKLVNEYGADVFLGQDALERGYVDELVPDYFSAIKMVMRELNLDPSTCQCVSAERSLGLLEKLTGASAKVSLRDRFLITVFGKKQFLLNKSQGKPLLMY